jgi:mono/diheme cytochrome c family protein
MLKIMIQNFQKVYIQPWASLTAPKSMRRKSNILALVLLSGIALLANTPAGAQKVRPWTAPESTNQLKNPVADDPQAPIEGKKLFESMCVPCHGEGGKGNGQASVALDPRPANFTAPDKKAESDGSLYWKMTEGRPPDLNSPMASYKTLLTDKQRWQIVTYIRKLQKK